MEPDYHAYFRDMAPAVEARAAAEMLEPGDQPVGLGCQLFGFEEKTRFKVSISLTNCGRLCPIDLE